MSLDYADIAAPQDAAPAADFSAVADPHPATADYGDIAEPHPVQAPAPGMNWRQSAAAEVQRRNLHPISDFGTMLAIYDAHRMAFGNDQERAAPDLGKQQAIEHAYQHQQAQQAENNSHGELASFAIEALHPAGGLFARGEQALAPIGDFLSSAAVPDIGEHMRQNAQQLLDVRGNEDSAGGIAGGLVGNVPVMANPLVAGGAAASDTFNQASQAQELNPNVSTGDVAVDTVSQAAIAAAMSYLLQGNVQGGAAKQIESRLAKYAPALVAKYGARGAVGALIGLGQTPMSNLATKATINPDQDLMQGGLRNALIGAGAEVGLTALTPNEPHLSNSDVAATPETPATVDTAEPAITPQRASGEENLSQPADKTPDLSGPFSAEDMTKYISLKSQDADVEGARQLLGDKQYELRDVPVTDLTTRGSTELKQGDIEKYASMPADSAPPVVADSEGQIIDGNRRLAAAQARGDETVKAYVPVTNGRSLASRLLSDESGGTQAFEKFHERTLQPQIEDTTTRLKKTWENVNRFLGTGLGASADEKRVGGKIVKSLGQQDLDRIRTEEGFKPFRDTVGKYSEAQKVQWVEDIEGAQPSFDPATQPAADMLRKLNAKNIADATAQGIDTTNWSEDWAGRLAEWPNQKGGKGGGSIAGSEGFLKSRKIDTFGEFKQAVEATGGKLKYENPIDMAIAKQAEVRKSIEARKILNDEITSGTIKKMKPGDKLPDGYALLDDRIAWKLGPKLAAPEGVAAKLNQFIAPGVETTLPIWKKVVQVAKGSAAMNFALSAWHIPTASGRNFGQSVGLALNNAFHGEFDLALKNLYRATPWEQARFGSRIRELAKNGSIDPSLEPVVQAIADAGGRFNVKSVLDQTRMEKAKASFAAGDPITGGVQLIGALGHGVTDPIMEKFVPNLKAGALASQAETLLNRQGATPASIAKEMRLAVLNTDHVLGQVVRENQFQHRVVSDVMDGIFAAPKFLEGDFRLAGSFGRDVVQGLHDLARGRKVNVTPAMYTVMGHVIAQATFGAMTMMAYTAATTGKPQVPTNLKDYFYPKTGRKNADGSDERITVPGPLSIYASVAREGPLKAVTNRVLPLWRAIDEVVQNSDYKNTQVRSGGAAKQTEQSAAHIGKSLIPYAGQSFVEKPAAGQPLSTDLKVAGFMGVRKAPASISRTPAEQKVHDLLSERPHPSQTPEQADRLQKVSEFVSAARSGTDGWRSDMRAAVKAGTITQTDVATINERATQKQDLPTLVRTSDLSSEEVMQVWDAATDDEKQQIRRVVMNKIQNSRSTSTDQKREFAARIRESK